MVLFLLTTNFDKDFWIDFFVALLPKDSSCMVCGNWFVVSAKLGKSQGICFILMCGNPEKLNGRFRWRESHTHSRMCEQGYRLLVLWTDINKISCPVLDFILLGASFWQFQSFGIKLCPKCLEVRGLITEKEILSLKTPQFSSLFSSQFLDFDWPVDEKAIIKL